VTEKMADLFLQELAAALLRKITLPDVLTGCHQRLHPRPCVYQPIRNNSRDLAIIANYQKDITKNACIINNRMITWPSKLIWITPGVSTRPHVMLIFRRGSTDTAQDRIPVNWISGRCQGRIQCYYPDAKKIHFFILFMQEYKSSKPIGAPLKTRTIAR
jgi:hypothetical protein